MVMKILINMFKSFDVEFLIWVIYHKEIINITTKVSTSLQAIKKAVQYLNKQGHLFIVVYIGHFEGKEESLKLMNMLVL